MFTQKKVIFTALVFTGLVKFKKHNSILPIR